MANSLSEQEKKRLQKILNTSYSSAFVNGSLAGGIGLGTLSSIYPALYSLSDENPFRSPESQQDAQSRSRQNIIGFGAGGFLVGAPIGGVVNTARLMLQKRRARKLLGKTAAWNDYAFNTGAGAAIGAGAGMAMNWALGRNLLDKRLLLGGTLVGGGIGAGVGRTKDLQRKSFETTQRTLKDCVQIENGVVKTGENGLPLIQDGIYYIRPSDAGVSDKPVVSTVQSLRDTIGHEQLMIICSNPLEAKYYVKNDPNERIVGMQKMKNGQYCFTIELDFDRRGPGGSKIKDNHGNLQKRIDVSMINDKYINPEPPEPGKPDQSYANAKRLTGSSSYSGDRLVDAFSGNRENLDDNFLVYKLTDDPRYNSEDVLRGAMQSIVAHGTIRGGRLTPWSPLGPVTRPIAQMFGMGVYDRSTCMDYVRWLVHGLQKEGFLPEEFSPTHFTDYAAIAGSSSFKNKNIGINAFGEWEPTQTILERRGQDPDLTTPYYHEGFPFFPAVINGIKNILGYSTSNNNG